MDTKLTLKLDSDIIETAKEYAKKRKTSLSKLIENYLSLLTELNSKKERSNVTPLVKSLSGVVKLPKGYDEKKGYGDYLLKKYCYYD